MKYLLLLVTFWSSFAFGIILPADKPDVNWAQNLIPNGGFERGLHLWTATGGTLALASKVSNSGDLLRGNFSALWTASGTQTFCSQKVSFDRHYAGQTGIGFIMAYNPGGTSFAANFQILDGTGATIGQQSMSISSGTAQRYYAATFPFPAAGGQVQLCISASGAEPLIALDDAWVGDRHEVNLPPTEHTVRGNIACSTASFFNATSENWITSVGNRSTGACTVGFATGTFSSFPSCFLQVPSNSATAPIFVWAGTETSTGIIANCSQSGAACSSNYTFDIICSGPF